MSRLRIPQDKMDSRISNPMSAGLRLVQDHNESPPVAACPTTVVIQTQPSADTSNNEGEGVSDSNEATNNTDWLQSLTANTTMHINEGQLNDTVGGGGVMGVASEETVLMGVQAGDWMGGLKGARFHNNGKYIIGYVDDAAELQELLSNYYKLTGTTFSPQHFNLVTKTIEDEYLQQRFLTRSARPRLFWQMHAGEPIIHYDGVPFITVGQCSDIHCVLAGKKKAANQIFVTTGDVVSTRMQSQGCTAKISIRRILRYPTSRISDTGTAQGITAMRKLRKSVLEVLTAKICAGLVKPTQRYYYSLPTPLAHDTHIVPEIEDPPNLLEQFHEEIVTLISSGGTSIGVIHDHIRKYVGTNRYSDGHVSIENESTFNPSRYELTRYIYWLYKSGQIIDQESSFKDRYSLHSTEENKAMPTATPTTPQSTDGNGLGNIYSMTVGETADLASLEIPAQVGAEEVTGTSSVAVTTNVTTPLTPYSHHQRKIGGVSQSPNLYGENEFDSESVNQCQAEVQSMLTILGNQVLACRDVSALQTLRRQLTSLCTELSMQLAGVGSKRGRSSPISKTT